MKKEASDLQRVSETISAWSVEKKANVSLTSYMLEIDTWRKLTGIDRVSRIVEIGCGSGLFIVAAIATGFAEFGLGIDPEIEAHGTAEGEIAWARGLRDTLGLSDRIEFRQVAMRDLLANNDSDRFDLVLFRNSLHHIHERPQDGEDREAADQRCVDDLAAARGLLKDPGYIHVMDASRPSWLYGAVYNRYRKLARKSRLNWRAKRTKNEWMTILSSAGFTHIKSETLPVNKWIDNPVARRIGRLVSSSVLIVGAR